VDYERRDVRRQVQVTYSRLPFCAPSIREILSWRGCRIHGRFDLAMHWPQGCHLGTMIELGLYFCEDVWSK